MRVLAQVRHRGWWITFVLLMVTALLASVLVGAFLARLSQPSELGRSTVGEWVEFTNVGLRARVDDVTVATEFPRASDPAQVKTAPAGMAFLRVRMTIEPSTDGNGSTYCSLQLHNGDGEHLTLTESGVEGPSSSDCSPPTDGEPGGEGTGFETQTVFVIIAEPSKTYVLELHTVDDDRDVFHTITL